MYHVYPVLDVIAHRLRDTAQKYPLHLVITFSFFVKSQIVFDKLKEEVKNFVALLGRFLAKNTQHIDGPQVC